MSNHHVDFSMSHCTQRTCLNGHVITNYADTGMDSAQVWCHICGAKTIDACPSCNGPLKGADKFASTSHQPTKPHAYCLHCGKALPWTEAHLDALRETAKNVDGLNDEDRKMLSEILPDIASKAQTPRTELAIVKMKSLFKKGGETFVEASRKILIDVMSEAVKKSLFPG